MKEKLRRKTVSHFSSAIWMGMESNKNEKHLPMWNIQIDLCVEFLFVLFSFIWFGLQNGLRWSNNWFRVHFIAWVEFHWNFMYWYWTNTKYTPNLFFRRKEIFISKILKKNQMRMTTVRYKSVCSCSRYFLCLTDEIMDAVKICDAQRFILLNCPLCHHSFGWPIAWPCQCETVNLSLSHIIFNFTFACPLAHSYVPNSTLVLINAVMKFGHHLLDIKSIISYFERQWF